MLDAFVGKSGTSVLYIGCMVPMWGVAVRLSYTQDAWCLKVKPLKVIFFRDSKLSFLCVCHISNFATCFAHLMIVD